MCGELGAYWKCTLCGQRMHYKKGSAAKQTMLTCCVDWHDESFFGLAYADSHLVGVNKKDWEMPTPQQRKENVEHIRKLKREYLEKKWKQEDALA